jgi:serine/threonine-protein kinase HipA
MIRAQKMSIQGVQPKISARLDAEAKNFLIVNTGGQFILKPQSHLYNNLPENEDVTMKCAQIVGIDVPDHGMIYSKDNSLTYWIRRFDRIGQRTKLGVEDFAQLSGMERETKYNSSMEKVASVIDRFCTFPVVEKAKLFRLTVFNFLVGNEDMHLKNYSLISRDGLVQLTPAYDLINTTIVVPDPSEEIALPLNGKKNRLSFLDIIDYFGKQRLELTEKTISDTLSTFKTSRARWEECLSISFLPATAQELYKRVLDTRFNLLAP